MKAWPLLLVMLSASMLLALAAQTPAIHTQPSSKKPYVLVWMCLDICEPGRDEMHINHVRAYRSLLDAVSYEAYILGPGGLLERHPRIAWDVTPEIRDIGLEAWPMIVSSNIQNIRALFDNQDSFIAQAVGIAISKNITGFNIDFEPTGGATHEDAVRYAEFLDRFAAELHKHGFKLSVDVARWSPIWDLDLLARTRVDYIIDMSTYASRDTTFVKYLDRDLEEIPEDKLVVGLCTYNLSSDTLFPDHEVAFRFAKLINRGVERIAIWRTMLPAYWWRYIKLYREAMPIPATLTRVAAVTVTDTATSTVTSTVTRTSLETVTSTTTVTETSVTTVSTTIKATITRLQAHTTTITSTITATSTSTATSTTTLTVSKPSIGALAAAAAIAFIVGALLSYLGSRRT